MTTDKASFHIEVPMDKLHLAKTVLQAIDVDLDLEEDMFHLPQDNIMWSIFTGRNGQYAIDAINKHIQQDPQNPGPITQAFDNMSPETRRDILELATLHIEWSTDYHPVVDGMDRNVLEQLLEDHPETTGHPPEPEAVTCPSCNGAKEHEGMLYGPSGCRPGTVPCSPCKGTGIINRH